jgi:hypothetical protein
MVRSSRENKLQFRRVNLIQKLDDGPKKFINIVEYVTCKRCLEMTEKPEVNPQVLGERATIVSEETR